jgi:hypothetical protein
MSIRQFVALVMSALTAIAQAVIATTRLVWEGGKWVLKSLSPVPPARQAPAAAGSAADALSALAEVTETPAPASAALPAPEAVDPVVEWGLVAQQYAMSQISVTGGDEPSLALLDEPATAWLKSLATIDLVRVANYPSGRVGEHMLGQRPISGLPLCPTMREWEAVQRDAAQMTAEERLRLAEGHAAMQAALDDLVNNPDWEPLRGIS